MRPVRFPPLSTCLALGWLILAAPVVALAAEPSASEISVARRFFEEGSALEGEAKWLEAADRFRRAAAIKDTPGIRFHLARCEEERGALVEALLEYDRARELLEGGAKAPDVEKLLKPAHERVKSRVALLTIRLPSEASSARVEVDGKPLSSSVLGQPLPFNPGKHQLMAVAPGRETHKEELELGAGETRELVLVLPLSPASPSRTSAAPARKPARESANASGPSARAIALVGEATLFAAGLGVGIGYSIASASAQDRLTLASSRVVRSVGGNDADGNACAQAEPPAACADLNRAREDRIQSDRLATAGFIGAGASAAAFALTWWLWPRQTEPVVQLGVLPAPGLLSLSLSGRL